MFGKKEDNTGDENYFKDPLKDILKSKQSAENNIVFGKDNIDSDKTMNNLERIIVNNSKDYRETEKIFKYDGTVIDNVKLVEENCNDLNENQNLMHIDEIVSEENKNFIVENITDIKNPFEEFSFSKDNSPNNRKFDKDDKDLKANSIFAIGDDKRVNSYSIERDTTVDTSKIVVININDNKNDHLLSSYDYLKEFTKSKEMPDNIRELDKSETNLKTKAIDNDEKIDIYDTIQNCTDDLSKTNAKDDDFNGSFDYDDDVESSDSSLIGCINDLQSFSSDEEEKAKKFVPLTKGEFTLSDLPPIEDLTLEVPDDIQLIKLGTIMSIVDVLVIIHSEGEAPALDIESILFLDGKVPLGQIFETFGPVKSPWYSIRFNSVDEIKRNQFIKLKAQIFYAPQMTNWTKFVFLEELRRIRGSDASWKDNNEPPEGVLDYSDDEQERNVKKSKSQKRNQSSEVSDNANKQNQSSEIPANGNNASRNQSWPPKINNNSDDNNFSSGNFNGLGKRPNRRRNNRGKSVNNNFPLNENRSESAVVASEICLNSDSNASNNSQGGRYNNNAVSGRGYGKMGGSNQQQNPFRYNYQSTYRASAMNRFYDQNCLRDNSFMLAPNSLISNSYASVGLSGNLACVPNFNGNPPCPPIFSANPPYSPVYSGNPPFAPINNFDNSTGSAVSPMTGGRNLLINNTSGFHGNLQNANSAQSINSSVNYLSGLQNTGFQQNMSYRGGIFTVPWNDCAPRPSERFCFTSPPPNFIRPPIFGRLPNFDEDRKIVDLTRPPPPLPLPKN